MRRSFTIFVSALLFAPFCVAQFELGSIVGIVRHRSQAPVAGAKVEVRSLTTNLVRELTTSATGEFNSLSLPPGRYTVKVSQTGFGDKTQNIDLPVGQRAELDFALEIGAVSEQVTVAAEAPLLESASSELSNVRTEKQIADLP